MPVAEDLADIFECGAVAEHAGGEGMAQQVRSPEGEVQTGALLCRHTTSLTAW